MSGGSHWVLTGPRAELHLILRSMDVRSSPVQSNTHARVDAGDQLQLQCTSAQVKAADADQASRQLRSGGICATSCAPAGARPVTDAG